MSFADNYRAPGEVQINGVRARLIPATWRRNPGEVVRTPVTFNVAVAGKYFAVGSSNYFSTRYLVGARHTAEEERIGLEQFVALASRSISDRISFASDKGRAFNEGLRRYVPLQAVVRSYVAYVRDANRNSEMSRESAATWFGEWSTRLGPMPFEILADFLTERDHAIARDEKGLPDVWRAMALLAQSDSPRLVSDLLEAGVDFWRLTYFYDQYRRSGIRVVV